MDAAAADGAPARRPARWTVGVLHWALLGCVVLSAGLLAGCSAEPTVTWDDVEQLVAHDFPGTPSMTPAQLTDWLNDQRRPRPLLLDARSPEEYRVSHLAQAHPASDLDQALQLLGGRASDTPVVAYCSVGYRSAGLVRALRSRGFTQVFNLEGSIFRWANEGRPLVAEDGPAHRVHPFDAVWGRLLKPELRWTPDQAGDE